MRPGPWRERAVTASTVVAVVAVVAAGLVAFTTTGELSVRPTSADPRVARQLSLTTLWGTRTRTDPDGTDWIGATAQVGTIVNVGPSTTSGFRAALDDLLGDRSRVLEDSRVVRSFQTTRNADGTTSAQVSVLAATPKGMFLLGFEGTDQLDLYVDPPIKTLSADARPGDHWSGRGRWGDGTYEYRYRIERADPVHTVAGTKTDCIELHAAFRIDGDDPVDSREVACPGIGSVRERFGATRVELVSTPGVPAPKTAPGGSGPAAAGPVVSGDADRWVLEPVAQLSDQYGSKPPGPPAVIGGEDPLVVAADGRTRTIQAFSANDGGLPRWRAGLGAVPRGRIGVDPEDGTTYVGTPDRRVYAFDRVGLLRWVVQSGDNVAAAPARAGSVVVVAGEDGRIRAFDAGTGAPRWRVDLGTPSVVDPAVIGDDVVVGDDDGVVRRLAGRNGAERWKVDVGSAVVDAPLVVDGDVIVSGTDGLVSRLDGRTGDAEWTAAQLDRAVGGPVASGGTVVTVDTGGWVSGYDLADGSRTYQRRDLGAVGPAVAVADGVVVAQRSGVLVALDRRGRTTRRWPTADGLPDRLGVPVQFTGASFGAVGGAGAVWLVDDAATLWRLGPPREVPTVGRTWVRHVGELREEPAVQFAVGDGRSGVLVVDRDAVSSLDPETGVERRLAALPPKLETVDAATVMGDVLVLTTTHELVGLGTSDGRLRWRTPHARTSNVAPTPFGSALALRSSGPSSELVLIAAQDGSVLGRIPTGDDPTGAQAVVCRGALVVPAGGGTVLIVAPTETSSVAGGFAPDLRSLGCDEARGRLWAVGIDGDHAEATWADAATGAVEGSVELGRREVGPWDQVQVVGDTVVVPSLVAGLVGLDAQTGAIRWNRPPGLLRALRAVVIGGEVWIVDRTGRTEVLDAQTGRVVRTERGFAEDLSSYNLLLAPIAVGDRVVLANQRALWSVPLDGPR